MMSFNMSKSGKKQLMPGLFAVFMVYSVIYHIMMIRTLQKDMSDEECATQAHAGGLLSPYCLELEAFKDWHKHGAEDLLVESTPVSDEIASPATEKTPSGHAAVVVDKSGAVHSISEDLSGLEKSFNQLVVSGVHLDVKQDQDTNSAQEDVELKRLEERKQRLARFDALEREVRESLQVSHESPWAHDLTELQHHLEDELKQHDAMHHHDQQTKLDMLQNAVQKSLTISNQSTPWAKDLAAAKTHLAYQLATHASKFHGHFATEEQQAQLKELGTSVASTPDYSQDTPWSRDLKMLQQRLEFELHSHTRHHHSPEEAAEQLNQRNHSSLNFSEPLKTWSTHLKDFHTFHLELQKRHKERVEQRVTLKKEISERMGKLEGKLADLVADRKAWESTLLNKYDKTSLKDQAKSGKEKLPSTSFMSKRLQWSKVPSWAPYKNQEVSDVHSGPAQPVVIHKSDVRHLEWTGQFPKIAAIASIRGARRTRARMMYFVDNFKLQDYEGPRELVLVYHYKDTMAAQLMKKYANTTDVRVVAAHDFSQESFPSDPALRYAAWASDADVIAQWDFDAWHDPSSLSMQVRAMAHTGKHASVLSMSSTSHSQEDEGKEISLSSIVGERSWMKEHWHPFSKRILEVNETFKAGQLVELDMDNKKMMNNISRIEHVFVEAKKAQPTSYPAKMENKTTDDDTDGETRFSHDIKECLGYEPHKGHASDDAAEKAIRENVGPEFGKRFHDMAKKRRDITLKLQLLCFQTSMEKDPNKWKFMHEHVLEMVRVRAELDKHIHNTAAVFGVAEAQQGIGRSLEQSI